MKEADSSSHDQEYEIFMAASELPLGERDSYLEKACANDEEQRSRVEELLRCHDSSPKDFLEQAAFREEREETVFLGTREKPGDFVGPYELKKELGEGGFGVVFLADQTSPVKRQVALKIIKPGMETKEVVTRFEAERQALATMDHPGIAKVFDGGATDSGRPYFVMEFVDGVPVNEFCTAARLDTRQRLRMFCDICEAVQHAHEKGIVHRDLKPTNILVRSEGKGFSVKVIDFGVAKALSQELTEKTLYTAQGQVVGTLQYMSPEQSGRGSVTVDKRTDVYSLGAVLYELLVDQPHLDPKILRRAGFEEILRLIREEEAQRPSSRLSRLSQKEITAITEAHGELPEKLTRLLKGDLDWVVMKALEKEKDRRYDSAASLASDLRRFLASEPVTARPPSMVYLLRKFSKRNRAVLQTAAITLLICATVVIAALAARNANTDPSGFAEIDTVSAPGYMVAAHPYLRKMYGISITDIVPPGSKVVFMNNLTLYNGDAVAPKNTQNFLTQVNAAGELPSYTMSFSEEVNTVTLKRPALYSATGSGITHPAWKVIAFDKNGKELDSAGEELIRQFPEFNDGRVPAKTFMLKATGEKIAAVRVESNNRLNDVPFAAFDAVLFEDLILDPMPEDE